MFELTKEQMEIVKPMFDEVSAMNDAGRTDCMVVGQVLMTNDGIGALSCRLFTGQDAEELQRIGGGRGTTDGKTYDVHKIGGK